MDTKACRRPFFNEGAVHYTFDVLLHIVVLSTLLQVLFEWKIKNVEHNVLKTQAAHVLRDYLRSTTAETRAHIAAVVQTPVVQSLKSLTLRDDDHVTINSLVISRNRLFIGCLAVSTAAFLYTTAAGCGAPWMPLLRRTLLSTAGLLVVAGVLEIVFFQRVVQKYEAVPPSKISLTLLRTLQDTVQNADTQLASGGRRSERPPADPSLPARVRLGGLFAGLAVLVALGRHHTQAVHVLNPATLLWSGVAVAVVVGTLFFTAGARQEELILEATVQRVVNTTFGVFYNSLLKTRPAEAARLKLRIEHLHSPDMRKKDAQCAANNNSRRKVAVGILAVAVGGAVAGTAAQRVVFSSLRRRGHPSFVDDSAPTVLRTMLLAAACSFLAEYSFLVQVVAPTRPISVQEAGVTLLEEVLEVHTDTPLCHEPPRSVVAGQPEHGAWI